MNTRARWEKVFMVIASLWGIIRTLVARPDVIVFGNDTLGAGAYDPRMGRLYEWLQLRKVPYAHLVHASPHSSVIRYWLQRRGPTVYLEGLESINSHLVSWLLHQSGAKQLWGIDDFRHWPRVIQAARKVHLKSILFQHGRFTRHQVGTYFPDSSYRGALPDIYIVWNEYWRKMLLRFSPPLVAHSNIVKVGGKPSAGQIPPLRSIPPRSGPLSVIVIHEPAAVPTEMRQLLDVLLGLGDVTVGYKVRADRSVDEQLRSMNLEEYLARGLVVVPDIPPYAQLVLGSYSTMLYEAIAQGIPVGIVSMTSSQADDLVQDGLATEIDPRMPNFAEQLSHAAEVSSAELDRRSQQLAVTADMDNTLAELLES